MIKFIKFHCIVLFQAFRTSLRTIIRNENKKIRRKIRRLSTSGEFNTCIASKGEREISRPISRADLLVRFRRKDPKVQTRIFSRES